MTSLRSPVKSPPSMSSDDPYGSGLTYVGNVDCRTCTIIIERYREIVESVGGIVSRRTRFRVTWEKINNKRGRTGREGGGGGGDDNIKICDRKSFLRGATGANEEEGMRARAGEYCNIIIFRTKKAGAHTHTARTHSRTWRTPRAAETV